MSGVRRHHILGLASLVACATLASGAAAADRTVAVGNDRTLSPSGNASIFTGDSVRWDWVGPDTDHIIESLPAQAEQWASDSVPGGINPTTDFLFVHAFSQTGAFNYQCRIHPDRMRGTITVADGRPTATFTMTPLAATTGERVDFDGMASTDPDGIVMGWEWDLDGDGTFEASGARPNHTYATAGTVTVSLRVTDTSARTHTVTKQLTVTSPPATVLGTPIALAQSATPATTPIVDSPSLVATLTASAAAKQRGAVTRGVTVEALCDLGCVVTATGSLVYPGGPKITLTKATKTLIAGQRLKIAMLIPAKSRPGLLKHLKKGKTATASIVVTTPDGASVRKIVKLTR